MAGKLLSKQNTEPGESFVLRGLIIRFDIEVPGKATSCLSFRAPFRTLVGKTGLELSLGCPSRLSRQQLGQDRAQLPCFLFLPSRPKPGSGE